MIVFKLSDDIDDTGKIKPRFASIFRFGAIVSLNMTAGEVDELTNDVRKHASDLIERGIEREEDYGMLVNDFPPSSGIVTGDYCIVPEISMDAFAIASNILAQTVALDSYNDTVDDLLEKFTRGTVL